MDVSLCLNCARFKKGTFRHRFLQDASPGQLMHFWKEQLGFPKECFSLSLFRFIVHPPAPTTKMHSLTKQMSTFSQIGALCDHKINCSSWSCEKSFCNFLFGPVYRYVVHVVQVGMVLNVVPRMHKSVGENFHLKIRKTRN